MFWFGRKKKKKDEFPFDEDEFFEEIEREMRKMMRMMQRIFEDMERVPPGQPVVKGIRIVIGPDGIPRVEEFGNVRRAPGGKPKITKYREPLVDVMEQGDKVIVTAELPGVEKKNIKIRADGNVLKITAEGEGPFRYRKEIDLPFRVDPKKAKATFKNGILEVVLEKEEEEAEGQEIAIE